MKNVAFITIHVGVNFGSILQTIATSEIIKRTGADAICINYIPPRVTEKRYWQESISSGKKFIRRLLFFPIQYISKKNYSLFLSTHCSLSEPIYSEDDFIKKCPPADVYITGSDQVWNYTHNEGLDKHYFFDGIQGKKIAYASSIGMTKLPKDYAEYMQKTLKTYSAISVREASAADMLSQWGITNTHVIDPTLMLTKEEWKKYASKKLYNDPYLFVFLPYNISNKNTIYSTIKKISSSKNLKIVSFSWYFKKDDIADKTIIFANPGDILSLFLHADYVVTNSFHGTAFSINLNKPFCAYMPSHFSTRLMSLLELCGLQNRILDDVISEETINHMVDFSDSNKVLEQERKKAMSFITNALS